MPKSLYIIDGHSQIFRAYYSPAARSRTVRSKPIGAVYLFTRMLQTLVKRYRPDFLVCVMDPKGKTFRNDIYPEYKANRGEMPEDLRDQMPVIIDMVKAFNIQLIIRDGFEADDVIGTLAKQAAHHNMEVRLVSKDKDLKQLLEPHIKLLNAEDGAEYGLEQLKEELGVTPEQFIDIQALAGDSVDNIPGAKGIGIKTAAELIKQYGTLDEVLKHAEEIKQPKRRENLIAFKPEAALSKQLVQIKTDVPGVKLDPEHASLKEPVKEVLLPMLQDLNFKSVMKDFGWDEMAGTVTAGEETQAESPARKGGAEKPRQAKSTGAQASLFGDVAPKPDVPKALLSADADVEYTLVDGKAALEKLLKAKAKRWSIHCAAESYDQLAGIAVCTEPGKAWYIPCEGKLDEALAAKLHDEKLPKIGHDLKADLRALLLRGHDIRGIESDTKLLAFLVDPSREDAKLASLSREFLGLDVIDWDKLFGDKKARKPLHQQPAERVMQYACQFADYALRVNDVLAPQVKKLGLEQLATDLEFPLIEVLGRMEHRGIKIDKPYLKTLSADFDKEIHTLEKACYKLAGREFTLGSPKQLGEVLYDELKLPEQGKTAKGTGRSTDQGALEALAPLHELPAKVLEWRHLTKLKSTYVDQLPDLADEHGRVHTTYRQTVATGRLSSKDPNLQNIPVRTDTGKKIRRAFIAEKGNVLVSADYSQIELRILAHIADEKPMIEAFKAGIDIHKATAAGIFGVSADKVTGEQRNVAKTVNYAVLYGQSAFGLSQGLGISRGEAKEFIDNYFNAHPRVAKLTDNVLEQCRKDGYVTTLAGRKRFLPDIGSKNVMVRKQAERQAFNTVLQGTAADLIKQAMLDAHNEIEKKKLPYKMLLQVHDELVFETPEKEAKACAEFAKKVMGDAMKLKVPLEVDAGAGTNWLEAK
ncbi:MAG: DNA polymerase I [Planctomycetes bacterium]|nr:DNA polymerase I [Planctomycetota bacterium]MCW8135283.1 DNA polymerase I [Planctomycetota bacterium]